MNINSLPNEILLQIFRNLTHNELGRISRVCRAWNECARSPILWKEVDVKFSWNRGHRNEIVSIFLEKLSFFVTHLKLDFGSCLWFGELNFEELCVKLNEKCPNLYALILHRALFSFSLPSIINLCSDFLPNLKVLILPHSIFGNKCKEKEHGRHFQIQILDVSFCQNIERSNMHTISKMSCLKKLNLFFAGVENNWFQYGINISFLQRLEYLNLGWTDIKFPIIRILLNETRYLTQLFLCRTDLHDNDFSFNNLAFLLLKTICLRECIRLTLKGVISLVNSCQSLENIYVDSDVAESYAKHRFITRNRSKLAIVKVIDDCEHHKELGYSFD